MNAGDEDYLRLLQRFLQHQISPQEFQVAFFARFQNEPPNMDETLFLLLDELFGALDCYTEDIGLQAERPGFYLDIKGLERESVEILRRLEAWRAAQIVL
ncbi:hypothetical protein KW842_15590 [Duganella sp. sic0402]|uniref:colicin immunity domain-containing protein n=1 Tax=Duganella sp. sic0402 TaxID=2854786 RepID=UPI001C441D1F|nr:colicin immunity domain-containing protein [Duganella sp. sic0402]MBV7537190.1 hypothetical protein [Duganella sp. sic0402]